MKRRCLALVGTVWWLVVGTPRRLVAQVNEVLAKCVAHNLCCVVKAIFTAGPAPTFWSDAPLALVQP